MVVPYFTKIVRAINSKTISKKLADHRDFSNFTKEVLLSEESQYGNAV